jgi:predicted RNA-binding Zn ribbon-like protein
VGGNVVLDFINTVTGRNGRPRDWLATFSSLADWATQTDVLPKERCRQLKMRAHHVPTEAAVALESARTLRELLFRVLTQLIRGRAPPHGDLAYLHEHWCRSIQRHALRRVRGKVQPVLVDSANTLDGIASAVALQAVDLLRDLPAKRLRLCAGPNCAWLFLDFSKAGRRKWCDMATCGNDAKAKRHYRARTKRSRSPQERAHRAPPRPAKGR